MAKQQRNCVFRGARLMHEMNLVRAETINIDLGHVLWQIIDLGLVYTPVIIVLPMTRQ